MASIDKRPNGKYLARWREYPGGPQKTKTFRRKIDAETFLTGVSHQLLSGTYVPPAAGQLTVAAYAEEWKNRRRRHWSESTRDRRERELRLHIIPEFGPWPLAGVRRAHIELWADALPLAPSSVECVVETFRALLGAAVADEKIARNPATRASLPQVGGAPVVPLTVEEVKSLAGGMVEQLRAAVPGAAGTGLRQGELFGLTADRINFLGRELRVDRQLWTPKKGRPFLAPLKSPLSYRTIALSPLTVDFFAAHIAAHGPGERLEYVERGKQRADRPVLQQGVLFHIGGRAISRGMGSGYLRRAVTAAGMTAAEAAREAAKGQPEAKIRELEAAARGLLVGTTWHDFRHHHASVLLSRGVSPALVAERLGHTIEELLRTYAHVIRSDEDRVRSIVDESLGGSAEDWLRTKAV
jgi:integrase